METKRFSTETCCVSLVEYVKEYPLKKYNKLAW